MSSTKVGTKGSDVYTIEGVDDPRVALSTLLVQGCEKETIRSILDTMVNNETLLEDLYVMLFQTRDVRGGKGIRDATLHMIHYFLEKPSQKFRMLEFLSLIPEYGSWRDLKVLGMNSTDEDVRNRVLQLFKDQLELDATSEETKISLAAKYAPRECHNNKQENTFVKELANRMFPEVEKMSGKLRAYRKMISAINKRIDTSEIKMCDRHFADIDPAKVPGRCLQKNTKAFLNQESSYKTPLHPRPSTDSDRIECAKRFTEHFERAANGLAKLNGSTTVFPHELIKKIYNSTKGSKLSREEKNATIGVWNQMVADAKKGGGLGRSLAMCDFSGSMQCSGSNGDTPYWVSMAMGFLISEVTTKEFEDVFLTFDSDPILHKLPKGDIFTRVTSITDTIGQGTSTDFQKAMDLVLQRCKQQRVKPGEEPEYLIVLTDMNWDEACGSSEASVWTGRMYRNHVKTAPWQTHVEMIRESFKRAGEDMWGRKEDGGLGGLTMPTIVIWNIAASSTDFHAKADTKGVVMLSGWSPSLFKVLQTDGIVEWTPYQALRAQLDNPRYDPVRALYKTTPY